MLSSPPPIPPTPQTLAIEMVLPSLGSGGMEAMAAALGEGLERLGHRVGYTCIHGVGRIGEELQVRGFPVALVPSPGIASLLWPGRLRRHFRLRNPDVIHVHSGAWPKTAMASLAVPRSRLIKTIHGRREGAGRVDRALQRLAATRTDVVVGVSEPLCQFLRQDVGLTASKVKLIPNGVDLTRFRPRPGLTALREELGISPHAILIGSVGRLVEGKNPFGLLHAFRLVVAALPDSHLVFLGDGPLRDRLSAAADTANLTDRVHLLGDRSDVALIYPQLSIFVLNSLAEGAPLSVLEAMASGCPTVATAVGGVPDLLDHGSCGVLVAPGSAVDLAAAILGLHNDGAMMESLRMAALRKAREKFGLDLMVHRYQDLYLSLARCPEMAQR